MKTITILIFFLCYTILHGESAVTPNARNVAIIVNTKSDRIDQTLIQLRSSADLKTVAGSLPESVLQSVKENYAAISAVTIPNPGKIGGDMSTLIANLNKQLAEQNIDVEISLERRADGRIRMAPAHFYTGKERIPLDRFLDFIGDSVGFSWIALPFGKIVFIAPAPIQ